MISGVMPKWKRVMYTFRFVLGLIAQAGMAFINERSRYPSLVVTLLLIAVAICTIVSLFWYRQRVIGEFTYDGAVLQFRTLGSLEWQTQAASEIVDIRDWEDKLGGGPGGQGGWLLVFRDGTRRCLALNAPNVLLLIERLHQQRAA
jgi:hypothetical protein